MAAAEMSVERLRVSANLSFSGNQPQSLCPSILILKGSMGRLATTEQEADGLHAQP